MGLTMPAKTIDCVDEPVAFLNRADNPLPISEKMRAAASRSRI